MRVIILLLALFVTLLEAHGQKKLDSLMSILESSPFNKSRVDLLIEIAQEYNHSLDSSKTFYYASSAARLAQKIGYQQGIMKIYFLKGELLIKNQEYSVAIDFFQKALKIAQKNNYETNVITTYQKLGSVYYNLGEFKNSLKTYGELLKYEELNNGLVSPKTLLGLGRTYYRLGIHEKALGCYLQMLVSYKSKKDRVGVANAYNAIAVIYYTQKSYEKSLNYYFEALNIHKSRGNKEKVIFIYINIGYSYYKLNRNNKALEYFTEALSLAKLLKHKHSLEAIYSALGEFYFSSGHLLKSLEYFQKGLKIGRNLKNKEGIAFSQVYIGKVFFKKEENIESIKWLRKGISIALEIGDIETAKEGYEYLSKCYFDERNYKEAYENQLLYKQIADSLNNQETSKMLTNLELSNRFQQEKDSLKLIDQQKQLTFEAEIKTRKAHQLVTVIGLGFTAILLIVSLFFYRDKYRNNQKLNQANEKLELSNDEINAINIALQETLTTLEKQHKDILGSINYAKRIQRAVLPLDDRLKNTLSEYFILYKPRNLVSGDFYWLEEVGNKQFIIAGDCTGHGVPGAFMTMLGTQALTNIIVQNKVHEPNQILVSLDKILRDLLQTEDTLVRDGMDIGVVMIDKIARQLHYSGAQNPLILVQDNKLTEVKADRYSINGHRKQNHTTISYTNHIFDIARSSTFYIYSDGYQDQFGGVNGKKFMKRRFISLLGDISQYPMAQQKQILEQTLEDWMEGYEQIDDILVMGIKV
ncbi:MAG TPA: hypothetical protein DCS93_14960 [Microscillaceae bacterium]|nr:hypothetical protein [Microscillaceae bacterium]